MLPWGKAHDKSTQSTRTLRFHAELTKKNTFKESKMIYRILKKLEKKVE